MNPIIQSKLPKIIAIFKQYGAYNVYLFGSATTEQFHQGSDVDFIYSFSKDIGYEDYANNYFALLESLENELGREVDLVAEKTLENLYLIQKINSQKVKIL